MLQADLRPLGRGRGSCRRRACRLARAQEGRGRRPCSSHRASLLTTLPHPSQVGSLHSEHSQLIIKTGSGATNVLNLWTSTPDAELFDHLTFHCSSDKTMYEHTHICTSYTYACVPLLVGISAQATAEHACRFSIMRLTMRL